LFSTDLSLSAAEIVQFYRARFQIEILQPQYPDKSEGLVDKVTSVLTVFWRTLEYSWKALKGISKDQWWWAVL
jgi:hypothetical protein